MGFRIISERRLERVAATLRQRTRSIWPATRRVGEYVAREARRRAPRSSGALGRSLNHTEPTHNVTVLQSPLAYARIKQTGGRIVAGSGPLGSRLLAIPLSPGAQRLMQSLGASQSLRTVQGLHFVATPRGMFLMGSPGLAEARARYEQRRAGGDKRARRPKERNYVVVIVLVPAVQVEATPYAPRMGDPAVRAFAAQTLRAYLTRA